MKPGQGEMPYISPLNAPISSLSGYGLHVLKVMFLNAAPLYAVDREYSGIGMQSSLGEHMWLSYLEWKLGSRGYLRHLYNHPHGQEHIRFGPRLKQSFYPDGIYRDSKTRTIHIYEYAGCHWHAHAVTGDCLIKPGVKLTDEDSIDTYRRLELSRKAYKDYEEGKPGEVVGEEWLPPWKVKIHVMYECQFKQAFRSDPDMIEFFSHHYQPRPLRRLVPRRCLYAPAGEVRQLHWKADPGSDYELVSRRTYEIKARELILNFYRRRIPISLPSTPVNRTGVEYPYVIPIMN